MKPTQIIRIASLSTLLALSACGQKGPLFLPEDPKAAETAATDKAMETTKDTQEKKAAE